jgi:hypothetical protein
MQAPRSQPFAATASGRRQLNKSCYLRRYWALTVLVRPEPTMTVLLRGVFQPGTGLNLIVCRPAAIPARVAPLSSQLPLSSIHLPPVGVAVLGLNMPLTAPVPSYRLMMPIP